MSVVYPQRRGWVSRLRAIGETDFCPWANRYVYWLKQPVGWFAIAALLSFLVGAFINPHGWILMSVIMAIMGVGMIWPWLAVRAVAGSLEPSLDCVHEGDQVELVVRMKNHSPLPQFGISIDGFLDRPAQDKSPLPSVALSCVPAMSEASYRLAVSPGMRGHYPLQVPTIACAFPFGIWTARRELKKVRKLTVWPRVFAIKDEVELGGNEAAEAGEGTRSGQAGEPLGVRAFRRGDRLKNVHWIHTARTGQVVVCERGGPQRQAVELILETNCNLSPWHASLGHDVQIRELWEESFAQRVRLLASIGVQLHARHTHMILTIGTEQHRISCGHQGKRQLLDLLAGVPVEGVPQISRQIDPARSVLQLLFRQGDSIQQVSVSMSGGRGALQGVNQSVQLSVFEPGFIDRMERFWRELRGSSRAA